MARALMQTNILNLNDDCIFLIYEKLRLIDQVNLSRVLQRFREIYRIFSKIHFKHFNTDRLERFDAQDLYTFFQITGDYIEKLKIVPTEDGDLMESLLSYCPNINEILLTGENRSSVPVFPIFIQENWIHTLEFHHFNDDIILTLEKLSALECLTIFVNFAFTGKYLHRMKNLKILRVEYCNHLESKYFGDICQSLKHLKELSTINCSNFPDAEITNIRYCQYLEKLSFTCNLEDGYEWLQTLPRLTDLSISECTSPLLSTIAKCKQLESLKLFKTFIDWERAILVTRLTQLKQLHFIGCPHEELHYWLHRLVALQNLEALSISNQNKFSFPTLLGLIRNCIKLKYISIRTFRHISAEFIKETLEILREQDRKVPLEISVDILTLATISLMENNPANANRNLLKFSINDRVISMSCESSGDFQSALEFERQLCEFNYFKKMTACPKIFNKHCAKCYHNDN